MSNLIATFTLFLFLRVSHREFPVVSICDIAFLEKKFAVVKKVILFLEKVELFALIGSQTLLAHYSNQRDISQEAGCVHNAPHFFRNSFYWL